MSILRSATETSQQGDWRPVAEGFRRFEIGKPTLQEDLKWGGLKLRLPLVLTPEEQERQLKEIGEPEPGTQQSWQSSYRPSLKLGWFDKTGAFQSTMLIDFLCAALGTENGKKFRKWIEKGGHGPRPEDKDDQAAEIALLEDWFGWFEGLQVYGTITHSKPDAQGRIWANFAGPIPLGSLPGQPEQDYQALCRGKLRALIEEAGVQDDELTPAKPVAAAPAKPVAAASAKKRTYDEIFEDKDDAPF
jgi:hypothetical protein